MSRPIKFRACDSAAGHFWYYEMVNGEIGWNHRAYGDGLKGLEAWQQYTGIKDKNGVEIYEGDIVYGRATWRGKHMATAVVAWSGAGFHCWGRDLTDWYTHEIIGHIYESPELLGAKS